MTSLARALAIPPASLAREPLREVLVAVLDSGIDGTHPDLRGRVLESVRVELAQGRPVLVAAQSDENNDAYGHGTAVASVLCKVSPNARILDVRVIDGGRVGAGTALLAGLRYAVQRRVAIVNMSVAANAEFAGKLHALCEQAYRQGQAIVAATRNTPLTDHGFPAELSSVISVDQGRTRSLFDWYYRQAHPIEYVAHGENVVVAAPGGGYTTKTGTSFATPTVSGLCALWLGAFADLRPFELKSLLKAFSAEPEGRIEDASPSPSRDTPLR